MQFSGEADLTSCWSSTPSARTATGTCKTSRRSDEAQSWSESLDAPVERLCGENTAARSVRTLPICVCSVFAALILCESKSRDADDVCNRTIHTAV